MRGSFRTRDQWRSCYPLWHDSKRRSGERVEEWPVTPEIIVGEDAKYATFRRAHLALAASGTVSLELALSGVPMVIAYRVDPIVKPFTGRLTRINSIVLPNIITGTNEIPEFLNGASAPENLAAALMRLLEDTPERRDQIAAFARLDSLMALPSGTPSELAADIVLDAAGFAGPAAGASVPIRSG